MVGEFTKHKTLWKNNVFYSLCSLIYHWGSPEPWGEWAGYKCNKTNRTLHPSGPHPGSRHSVAGLYKRGLTVMFMFRRDASKFFPDRKSSNQSMAADHNCKQVLFVHFLFCSLDLEVEDIPMWIQRMSVILMEGYFGTHINKGTIIYALCTNESHRNLHWIIRRTQEGTLGVLKLLTKYRTECMTFKQSSLQAHQSIPIFFCESLDVKIKFWMPGGGPGNWSEYPRLFDWITKALPFSKEFLLLLWSTAL